MLISFFFSWSLHHYIICGGGMTEISILPSWTWFLNLSPSVLSLSMYLHLFKICIHLTYKLNLTSTVPPITIASTTPAKLVQCHFLLVWFLNAPILLLNSIICLQVHPWTSEWTTALQQSVRLSMVQFSCPTVQQRENASRGNFLVFRVHKFHLWRK